MECGVMCGMVWGMEGGLWVLYEAGVWAGASVKSQGLPPTDSSKNSVTASAVGTSNEPSTAFNIPRPFMASVCIWVISMGYCIYVLMMWLYMCGYSTQWTCQTAAYPMSSANINPKSFRQILAAEANFQLSAPLHPPPFFFTQATWDFMISS